jgi:uncharacterized Ntn-hydrolase superfamily protein
MPTISILLKQGEERVICSFSCVNVTLPNMNIVGVGYMGVAQSYFTEENTNQLRDYIKDNNTINGFKSSYSNLRQYGVLFEDRYEIHHGENCLNYYGHYGTKDLLVIGNRVKSDELLFNLFNDLEKYKGPISHRVAESLIKNKIVGFDNQCSSLGVSCSSISYMKYDNIGNNINHEYYVGKDIDPIDYLYKKLIS